MSEGKTFNVCLLKMHDKMATSHINYLNVLTSETEHIRSSSETLLEMVDVVLIFVLNTCMYCTHT